MKILLIDDQNTYIEYMTTALNKLGHEVIDANNGKKGIELFISSRPDLIILDVNMPVMDGFECAAEIRKINCDEWIPIIFLSGQVDDEHIEKGINAGGDDYLPKPSSEITIASKIKAMQRISDMRKKLRYLSTTDSLTGIHNRLQFDIYFGKVIQESDKYNSSFALMFIDLDHFKMVNDNLGHTIGDLLLKEVAKRLKFCLRLDDFVARMGGDEFAIILPHLDNIDVVDNIAQKIIKILATPYKIYGHDIMISSSIGIAHYPIDGVNSTTLLQNADMAMYHAKALGRNNYQFYKKLEQSELKQRILLENELNFALDKNEFVMQFQPIYHLETKVMIGLESSIRWRHPRGGILLPEVFMPIAEETGMIFSLYTWAFKNIFKAAEDWELNRLKNFKMCFNIPPKLLLKKDLPQILGKFLDDLHLPGNLFEIGLTKNILLANPNMTEKTICALHELGMSFAIDGFGSGFLSLSHLKTLPIRTLKIAETFINSPISSTDSIIIDTIVQLGKKLNLQVSADGIASEDEVVLLLELGCTLGQGNYLCPFLEDYKISEILQNSVHE